METEEKAELWQHVILEVQAGRLNVTEAATQMCVSRKTYYEKQERALTAMLAALQDRPGGRPANQMDPEKKKLQEELEASRAAQENLAKRLRVQEVVGKILPKLEERLSACKKKTRGLNP